MSLHLLCRPASRKVLDLQEHERESSRHHAASPIKSFKGEPLGVSSKNNVKKQVLKEPSKKTKKSLSSHLEKSARRGRKKQAGDEEATIATSSSDTQCLSPPRSLSQRKLVRNRSMDSTCSTSSIKIKTQEESLMESFDDYDRTRSDKKCSFTHVTTHWHELALGDHPDVTQGVPVCLGEPCLVNPNDAVDSTASQQNKQRNTPLVDQVSVNEHVEERNQRNPCGDCWEDRARLSAKDRQRMLLEAGVPFQTIRNKMHCIKMQNHIQLRNRILTNLKDKKKTTAGADCDSVPKASHC